MDFFPFPAQANEILRKEPTVSGKNQQADSLREEVASVQDHTVNEEDIGSIMPTTLLREEQIAWVHETEMKGATQHEGTSSTTQRHCAANPHRNEGARPARNDRHHGT